MSEKTPAVIQIPSGEASLKLTYPAHKDLVFVQNLEAGEKAEIKKEMRPSHEKDWSFLFGIGWHGEVAKEVKQGKDYSCCLYLDVSLQYMLSRSIALRAIYNYLNGSSSSTGFGQTQDILTEYSGNHLGLSLPLYYSASENSRLFIAPEGGVLKSTQTYNGDNAYQEFDEEFEQGYYGVSLGKEWISESPESKSYGGYVLAGLRQFKDSSESSSKKAGFTPKVYGASTVLHVSIGISINF